MDMILLDTNAVIYYLQNETKVVSIIDILRKKNKNIAISTITEMEVLSYPHLDTEEIAKISMWLNEEIFVVSVDSFVAREAARIRRVFKLKSPDALIAATAIMLQGKLVTRDKVFKKIKGLSVIEC